MRYPGCRALLLRQTRRSLSLTILVTFERDVADPRRYPFVKSQSSPDNRPNYRYQNGSEISLGGLDDLQRYLSGEYDIIYIAQAEEVNVDVLDFLKTRLSNFRVGNWQSTLKPQCTKPQVIIKKCFNNEDSDVTLLPI